MKAVEVKEGIYWVGAVDWSLRNFHGYLTQRGSSYNAYLIIDEKVTLIDTVKENYKDEMLKRISNIIDPSKIDYIVSNHVEMDHSGSLPAIMEKCPNAKIITSPNGMKGLNAHYKNEWEFKVVKSREKIEIGKRTLEFILTPMVHWPDNMVCYVPEEKILFSNDGFGQHIASTERFDYEYSVDALFEEAKKYYANIVLPYSMQVKNELKVAKDLDIEMICPSHGIILKDTIKDIMQKYEQWSSNMTKKKALVIYDTMWKSTEKIAKAIQNTFEDAGYNTVLLSVQTNHVSDIMTEVIDAEYICVGSPTLNNNMLPTIAGFLAYLKGLAPKGRKGIAFGSFGWGGQSVGMIEENLKSVGFEIVDVIKNQYIPSEEALENIEKNLINKIN